MLVCICHGVVGPRNAVIDAGHVSIHCRFAPEVGLLILYSANAILCQTLLAVRLDQALRLLHARALLRTHQQLSQAVSDVSLRACLQAGELRRCEVRVGQLYLRSEHSVRKLDSRRQPLALLTSAHLLKFFCRQIGFLGCLRGYASLAGLSSVQVAHELDAIAQVFVCGTAATRHQIFNLL